MIQIQKNFLASNDELLNLEHSANQVLILCVLWLRQHWLVDLFDWKVSKMKIVRSTSSHATAGGSNETRETLRSGEIQAKGMVSLMTKEWALSPKGLNSNRLRYTKITDGQPPGDGEACHRQGSNGWKHLSSRSEWKERARTERTTKSTGRSSWSAAKSGGSRPWELITEGGVQEGSRMGP